MIASAGNGQVLVTMSTEEAVSLAKEVDSLAVVLIQLGIKAEVGTIIQLFTVMADAMRNEGQEQNG